MSTFAIRTIVAGFSLLTLAPSTGAGGRRLVGVIVGMSPHAVEISMSHGTSRTIRVDNKTRYVKWVTHQPWQQSTRADVTLLRAGRCISVELRAPAPDVAKVIRINTDEPGAVWNPCRQVQPSRPR